MPYTILIVDDNDSFRGMLNTVLGERGFKILAARSGADGLQLAAQHPIDAALVDVDMPGMDGFEFCRQLSAQDQDSGRKVPVWIMTGVLQLGLNRKATAVGALVVLRKPLDVDQLCGQLEKEISERAAAGGSSGAAEGANPPPAST